MTEIETMLCKVLDCDRSGLYLDGRRPALSVRQFNRLQKMLKKRVAGEPLQYLVGDADFIGLKLKVDPGVLIPRPETEFLVEQALARMHKQNKPLNVLDIGTGSGNIPIALAKSPQGARFGITSVDISQVCLDTARSNARRHNVADKIVFLKSDVFSGLKSFQSFDVIISNPPYVSADEYDTLPQDVKREPRTALVAADKGLYFYRRIEEGCRRYLKEGGVLFLEIGDQQADRVRKIFGDASVWGSVEIIKDYCQKDRIVVVKKGAIDPLS